MAEWLLERVAPFYFCSLILLGEWMLLPRASRFYRVQMPVRIRPRSIKKAVGEVMPEKGRQDHAHVIRWWCHVSAPLLGNTKLLTRVPKRIRAFTWFQARSDLKHYHVNALRTHIEQCSNRFARSSTEK